MGRFSLHPNQTCYHLQHPDDGTSVDDLPPPYTGFQPASISYPSSQYPIYRRCGKIAHSVPPDGGSPTCGLTMYPPGATSPGKKQRLPRRKAGRSSLRHILWWSNKRSCTADKHNIGVRHNVLAVAFTTDYIITPDDGAEHVTVQEVCTSYSQPVITNTG